MKFNRLPVAVAGLVFLGACGTIMHGGSQDIGISSSPSGAQVTIDNGPVSKTPYVANLSRKQNHIVHISADGYAPADLTLTNSVSGWVWGNLLFGGLVGLAVDAVSGGLYNLTPAQLETTLATQRTGAVIAPSKDGIYVILVQKADPAWTKVGQLRRLSVPLALGE